MLGTNGVSWMTEEYFKGTYVNYINSLKTNSPESIIIIESIPPVALSYIINEDFANNDKINKYNKILLAVALETGSKYLYTSQVLKDVNGELTKSYDSGDGLNWNELGYSKVLEFILKSESK